MPWLRTSGAALLACAAAPIAGALCVAKPALREGLRERLGLEADAGPVSPSGSIWLHAASVGESLAALRLVDELVRRGHAVSMSTTTTTGRDLLRRTRPDLAVRLAPLDHPFAVSAALTRVAPRALVLVETELWPSWIAGARRRGIPVAIVSGRISDRSFPRYRALRRLLRPTLARLALVGARAEEDAQRFVALGVDASRVRVTGDLKLEAPASPRALGDALSRVLGDIPILVAGSTHPGEEEAALIALAQAEAAGFDCALVLAPRHPGRSADVAALVRAAGRRVVLHSALPAAALSRGDVLVLDSIGELGTVYGAATLAFVGGTLVPVGGHNLLEPAQAGRPVVFGPQIANVRDAAERVLRADAGAVVEDGAALGAAFVTALRDPGSARARGEAGRSALAIHHGSAERSAALVESMLSAHGSS